MIAKAVKMEMQQNWLKIVWRSISLLLQATKATRFNPNMTPVETKSKTVVFPIHVFSSRPASQRTMYWICGSNKRFTRVTKKLMRRKFLSLVEDERSRLICVLARSRRNLLRPVVLSFEVNVAFWVNQVNQFSGQMRIEPIRVQIFERRAHLTNLLRDTGVGCTSTPWLIAATS